MLKKALCFVVCFAPCMGLAQDKTFTLNAPDSLVETGFLKHLLPRFSLKTGIRIQLDDGADGASFGQMGTAVFQRDGVIWHFDPGPDPDTAAFQAWLLSDIGKRTIEAFAPDGAPMFSADVALKPEVAVQPMTGDAALGETVSLTKCGRCHVVSDANRMKAIGSTPSFALLRGFDDWESRFLAFFALKPHPAFTQVEDVTEPFPAHLPSPISPIEVTLDEIDAIVAFVALMEPADLGAPIKSQ